MQVLYLGSDIAKGTFSDIAPQWLMTMLKSLKEDDRCYYVATTLVSLGVVYLVKKVFSFNKSKRVKTTDLHIEETADEITSNFKEVSNIRTVSRYTYISIQVRRIFQ
nr:uncharacterized protein LOC122270215 isoform X1 [Parasteatoda tepidariorum]